MPVKAFFSLFVGDGDSQIEGVSRMHAFRESCAKIREKMLRGFVDKGLNLHI